MDLNFSRSMGESYTSASQKIRVLSEDWVVRNIYCPNCGNNKISAYDNNNPAADFNCRACFFDYELKSSQKPATNKIVDGAYSTMMKVIQNNTNPNLFFLNYKNFSVINFFVIPKYFFSDYCLNTLLNSFKHITIDTAIIPDSSASL